MTSIREITEEQFHSFLSLDIPVAIWTVERTLQMPMDKDRFVIGSASIYGKYEHDPSVRELHMTYKQLYGHLGWGKDVKFYTLVEEDEDAAT